MNTINKHIPWLITLCVFFLSFFFPFQLFASQQLELKLEYPSFEGDFYAEGIVSFPPQAVGSADNIAVYDSDGSEVACKVSVLNSWGNGSVLKAHVIFAANISRQQAYVLKYGEGVRRQKTFEQTAVLPAVSFYAGGAPRAAENVNLDVGTINVRVDRSPGISYFWHIFPILFLLWLTWRRARRVRRAA